MQDLKEQRERVILASNPTQFGNGLPLQLIRHSSDGNLHWMLLRAESYRVSGYMIVLRRVAFHPRSIEIRNQEIATEFQNLAVYSCPLSFLEYPAWPEASAKEQAYSTAWRAEVRQWHARRRPSTYTLNRRYQVRPGWRSKGKDIEWLELTSRNPLQGITNLGPIKITPSFLGSVIIDHPVSTQSQVLAHHEPPRAAAQLSLL